MEHPDTNETRTESATPMRRGEDRTTETPGRARRDATRDVGESETTRTEPGRRRILRVLGTGTLLALAGCSSVTGKAPKDQVNYQDHPKGEQQCSNCQYYVPPEDGGNTGTCSRVTGDIEPDDWCSIYSEG